MDQWTEANWLDRTGPPTLRAVAGRSVRVLPHVPPQDLEDTGTDALAAVSATSHLFAARAELSQEPCGIRVFVVADDVLARRGMLAALDGEPGLIVVGEQRSGPEVSVPVAARHPDILLLHGLYGADAVPTLRAVRAASSTIRVLSVGARAQQTDQLEDGVCGRLPASATPDELIAAVRLAAAGFQLSRPPAEPAAQLEVAPDEPAGRPDGLTERECEVLRLVAEGMSNAEIAHALTLSEHTVKSHVQNLLGKLNLRNRIHAVIYAFEAGLRTV